MVALLTAPVNLIVDFLFVEVISAPTMESLKKESLASRANSTAFTQVLQGDAHAVRKVSAISKTIPAHQSRKSENWTGMITTTRVIPPRTREAHDEAMECANDVIEDAKLRQDHRLTQTKSRHEKYAAKSLQSNRLRQKVQGSVTSGSRISSILRVGNGDGDGRGPVDSTETVDVEVIFRQLTDDINLQRKLLKRNQQEAFDYLWGYFSPPSSSSFLSFSSFPDEGSIPQVNSLAKDRSLGCCGLM